MMRSEVRISYWQRISATLRIPFREELQDMRLNSRMLAVFSVLLCFAFSLSAADKKAKDTKGDDSAKPSYELPQPTVESLDLTMYQRIREEGLSHSHIMEFASALTDGIGPRLTGSPNLKKANEWTRDQLTGMGCVNAHLEDWGEFGMGWRQLNTWVRMSDPDTAVFIAQALPWSPSKTSTASTSAMSCTTTSITTAARPRSA